VLRNLRQSMTNMVRSIDGTDGVKFLVVPRFNKTIADSSVTAPSLYKTASLQHEGQNPAAAGAPTPATQRMRD
jgi:hypothetical protein